MMNMGAADPPACQPAKIGLWSRRLQSGFHIGLRQDIFDDFTVHIGETIVPTLETVG